MTEREPAPIHPVDALKDIAEQSGYILDPKREAELREICDVPVCSACGRPIPVMLATLEDKSDAARERMLEAMSKLMLRMTKTEQVEGFMLMQTDSDSYVIELSFKPSAPG